MKALVALCAGVAIAAAWPAVAAEKTEVTIKMHKIDANGIGAEIGRIHFKDGPKGLVVSPRLRDLPPGAHGFHVHEKHSCKPGKTPDGKMAPGLAAGGHYDPDKSGKHEGPAGRGHKGDLPALEVAADGTASKSVAAPRLKVADLKGRAIMIHAGGDNYSDQPAPLGGGGGRIACGTY